jgi:hypothetical protein
MHRACDLHDGASMKSKKTSEWRTMERANAEMRAPRLARAVIAAHIGWMEQVREQADDFEACERLRAAVEELEGTVESLFELHPLRMAAEHTAIVHERWAQDPETEALVMVLACALLSRVLEDTSYAFRVGS